MISYSSLSQQKKLSQILLDVRTSISGQTRMNFVWTESVPKLERHELLPAGLPMAGPSPRSRCSVSGVDSRAILRGSAPADEATAFPKRINPPRRPVKHSRHGAPLGQAFILLVQGSCRGTPTLNKTGRRAIVVKGLRIWRSDVRSKT